MKPTIMNLDVGTQLNLQPANGEAEQGFTTELIGYVPERSLLVSYPGELAPTEGGLYDVRISAGESTYAFQTKILLLCKQPYPYAHIEYPAGIQGVSLRRAQRVGINKPALVMKLEEGKTSVAVTMVDISPFGARLLCDQPIGEVGESFDIELGAKHPDEQVVLPFAIRYIGKSPAPEESATLQYGVEFLKLDQKARAFIGQLVSNKITELRRPSD